jgi:preprotein translocase subunit Sec63
MIERIIDSLPLVWQIPEVKLVVVVGMLVTGDIVRRAVARWWRKRATEKKREVAGVGR